MGASPFNQIIAILGFLFAEVCCVTFRIPETTRIGVDNDIAFAAPINGVRRFKAGVLRDKVMSTAAMFAIRTPSNKNGAFLRRVYGGHVCQK